MEITKKDIDSLNAVVTVAVKAEDYTDKVQKILNNYRKTQIYRVLEKDTFLWEWLKNNMVKRF